MKKCAFYSLIIFNNLCLLSTLSAQKKIVVMGSSTAAGQGSSSPSTSWVGRTQAHFRQNMADGLDTIVTSIAYSGQTTYHQMHTGFVSPVPGRPAPDPNSNVTKALSLSPDIIIINLPTNDVANGYTKKESMDNFRLMFQTISAANVRCYIATSQPRSLTTDLKDSLRTLVDSINNNFGLFSIDFWTDIVTTDGLNNIKPEVSVGDGIHINDPGHNYLFIRVRNKNLFAFNTPLPLKLLDFSAQLHNEKVLLKWQSVSDEAGSTFELQRKTESRNEFLPVYTKPATVIGLATEYSWTDQNPLPGLNLYRLKMIDPNKVSYSSTVSFFYKPKDLDIRRIYTISTSSNLQAEINSQKKQSVNIEIINTLGMSVFQQSQNLTAGINTVVVPVNHLVGGYYFFRIRSFDNSFSIKAFTK